MYLNRGEAIDSREEWHEHTLEVPEGFTEPIEETPIYRSVGPNYKTNWFLSEKEARNEAGNREITYIDEAILMPPTLHPVSPPIMKVLKKNEKGNLGARANIHPEIYGSKSDGMILFPSKWCDQDALCEGPAIITQIIERETYGFYFAEMLKYQLPEQAVIAKFIRKHSLENATFKFIRSKFGEYIRIENIAYNLRAIRFMRKDDIIAKHMDINKKKIVAYKHPVYDGSNEEVYMMLTGAEYLAKFDTENNTNS